MADLGRFVLESDKDTASSLPLEEASLYECVKLSGSNISAYLVDGDFSFAALEQLGSQKAAAPHEEEEPEVGGEAEDPPSVSTDMTAALTQAQGKALGGSAVFIPLLERCGTSASLQAARFPHPSLPPVKLQLQVPKLRFFFSPARLGRILRAVDAVMPGLKPACRAVPGPTALVALICSFKVGVAAASFKVSPDQERLLLMCCAQYFASFVQDSWTISVTVVPASLNIVG